MLSALLEGSQKESPRSSHFDVSPRAGCPAAGPVDPQQVAVMGWDLGVKWGSKKKWSSLWAE